MGERPPDYSVIIEWHNLRFVSDDSRHKRMLDTLSVQMQEVELAGEVLALYDRKKIDGCELEDELRNHLHGQDVRAIPTVDSGYYELKNQGMRQARGSVIVMLDSDCIPEPQWLSRLLRAFEDPTIQVIGSSSYVDPTDIYSKAMALCWVFPLRPADGPIHESNLFFANSVGMLKSVADRFPFPEDPARFRGQCLDLSRTLRDHGIKVFRHPRARVAHPLPGEMTRFIRRALCHGHDHFHTHLGRCGSRATAFAISLCGPLSHMAASQWRIVRKRSSVNLSALAVPAASLIALAYDTLMLCGVMIATLDPQFCIRHYEV